MNEQVSCEVDFELSIDEEEYNKVMRLQRLLRGDERNFSGMFWVFSDGEVRRWAVADQYRLMVVDAGPDSDRYTVPVSPRALYAWVTASGGTGEASLRIIGDGESRWLEMLGSGGSFSTGFADGLGLEIGKVFAERRIGSGATPLAVLEAEAFFELMRAARVGPYPVADDESLTFRFIVDEGALVVQVDWDECGTASHRLPAETSGTGEALLDQRQLWELLECLEPGEVKILLPEHEDQALELAQSGSYASVMPLFEHFDAVDRVRASIESVFGPEAAQDDDEGCFSLSLYGVQVYAHLILAERSTLSMSATVMTNVPKSHELLEELNDLNSSSAFARVVYKGGAVLAVGELVADTIDDAELEALYSSIRRTATDLGPVLLARFGGDDVAGDEEDRWRAYLDTTVVAETRPNQLLPLSGPDAVIDWDLPDEVFVVTAFNPFGRPRPHDVNVAALAELAGDLITAGGTAIRAIGSSADGDYSEPSLLAWGLSEDAVSAIAAKHRQEAFFRLSADEIEVVGALVDARVGRPRIEPAD